MNFLFENCLSFLTVLTVFNAVFCGQYQPKGQESGHNDIGYEDDNKYPYQPYGFGYDIDDGYGNKQWRHEKSQQPSNVIGSYGFKDKDGIMREVEYVADKNGFRARIRTNEPGTAPKDPGDVKFEAQPVMVSNYAKASVHEPHGDNDKYGGVAQEYDPKSSSSAQRIQHRVGRVGRGGRLRYSASVPRYTYVPYYGY